MLAFRVVAGQVLKEIAYVANVGADDDFVESEQVHLPEILSRNQRYNVLFISTKR